MLRSIVIFLSVVPVTAYITQTLRSSQPTYGHFAIRRDKVFQQIQNQKRRLTPLYSFVADSSDYKSSDSDFASDDDSLSEFGVPVNLESEDAAPTELLPVPMSPNAGNRFLAVVFDRTLKLKDDENFDVMDMHEERISLSEEHVMFCRKANLYNETFNVESKADVLWSHQL